MDFYHVRRSPNAVAVHCSSAPSALNAAFEYLEREKQRLSAATIKHFENFCKITNVAVSAQPLDAESVSLQRLEETDQAEAPLIFHARGSGLLILGGYRRKPLREVVFGGARKC